MKLLPPFLFALLFSSAVKAQSGAWSVMYFPTPIGQPRAATCGNKVFFIDHQNTKYVYIFDALANTWTTDSLPFPKKNTSIGSLGSKIFITGDSTYYNSTSKIVYVFDSNTNQWSTTSLSSSRSDVQICSFDSKVYFVGGYVISPGPMGSSIYYGTQTIDVYDSLSNSWSVMNMPNGRTYHSAYAQNNKLFIGGGVTYYLLGGNYVPNNTYDMTTNTWQIDSLGTTAHRVHFSGIDNDVFMFYDYDLNNPSTAPNVSAYERYDAGAGQWSSASFANARLTKAAIAGTDRIFIGGNNQYLDVYYAPSNSFYTDSLPLNRDYICFATANNKFFFAGGMIPPSYTVTDHIDVFDLNGVVKLSEHDAAGNVQLYPNPASSGTTVKLGKQEERIHAEIRDISGKTMLAHNYTNVSSIDLNTSELSTGIYFVYLQTESYSLQKKLFISK